MLNKIIYGITVFVVLMLVLPLSVFGQEAAVADTLLESTEGEILQEISLSKFEDPGFWRTHVPIDYGIVEHARFLGGPDGKTSIEGQDLVGTSFEDEYVLGVKTSFLRRGITDITVLPSRPLIVPGEAKTASVWVIGRNLNADLHMLLRDSQNEPKMVHMGKMNFFGWQQMTAAIPSGLSQQDYLRPEAEGLRFMGFLIEPELSETYGSYYIYFDDLRFLSDVSYDILREPDDIQDIW